ncbi:zinc ribbon domain-containing protein [Methylobacterium sp. WL122]|nr:zinc ribbon domain-containing protein [Methylobacterium sp. WL122]
MPHSAEVEAEDDDLHDLNAVEARADYIDEDQIIAVTSMGDWFEAIHNELLTVQTVLIVGPRGCGKTHMMRYTWMKCRRSEDLPLAIYVSFNRYLRLEPWMHRRVDAMKLFNAWVLAQIVDATLDVMEKLTGQAFNLAPDFLFDRHDLKLAYARLESHIAGDGLNDKDEEVIRDLTVPRVIDLIRRACAHADRRRAVVLFDDAALTLTPAFMTDFFDVVRAIKQRDIAPKCSVYPGTTQYGSRFHVHQEAYVVPVWLDVGADEYGAIMETIVQLRNPQAAAFIKPDVSRMLMFAAFGVPRAYLSMMGRLLKLGKQGQPEINKVIQALRTHQLGEFRSIEQKLPQFKTLIQTGEIFFQRIVEAVVEEGLKRKQIENEKNWLLLFEKTEMPNLATRMIKFLIEAGLLYEGQEVMHGGLERVYTKYTPHLSALIAARAFAGGSRGTSPAAFTEYTKRKAMHHGARRKLTTLLKKPEIHGLRFDLPACPQCGAERLSETQKFCHECANTLPRPSTYFRLMGLPIDKVPILTRWARDRLKEQGISTIQDLMSFEDPGTELRKIHRVGPKRARRYIEIIEDHVNESLLS